MISYDENFEVIVIFRIKNIIVVNKLKRILKKKGQSLQFQNQIVCWRVFQNLCVKLVSRRVSARKTGVLPVLFEPGPRSAFRGRIRTNYVFFCKAKELKNILSKPFSILPGPFLNSADKSSHKKSVLRALRSVIVHLVKFLCLVRLYEATI